MMRNLTQSPTTTTATQTTTMMTSSGTTMPTDGPREETVIVPTPDGVDLVAASPVREDDPLADFKDDKRYRSKRLTPRTALRRAINRRSRLTPESRGLAPGVGALLAEWDAEFGVGNRQVVDDLVLILEAAARRENLKSGETVEIVREIIDQTDGPMKDTIQHDVTLMSIKVVELPESEARRL